MNNTLVVKAGIVKVACHLYLIIISTKGYILSEWVLLNSKWSFWSVILRREQAIFQWDDDDDDDELHFVLDQHD
jgi:hypothetical protein